MKKNQNHSVQTLLKHLIENNRADVGQSEINAVARSVSDKKGTSYLMEQQRALEFFRNRGWTINLRG